MFSLGHVLARRGRSPGPGVVSAAARHAAPAASGRGIAGAVVGRRPAGTGRRARLRSRSCWPASVAFSDMWSMSMTIPSRIASSSASSPAVVRPDLVAVAAGRTSPLPRASAVPGARASSPGSSFSHSADRDRDAASMIVLVTVGRRPVEPSSVSGSRPVRAHVLTMNMHVVERHPAERVVAQVDEVDLDDAELAQVLEVVVDRVVDRRRDRSVVRGRVVN